MEKRGLSPVQSGGCPQKKMNDKKLGSKTLYTGKTLNLEVAQFENENGLKYEREIIHRKDAVAIVALLENKNVLLVKQYRAPLEQPIVELPAGIVEDDNPEHTAYRELIEETGYIPGKLKLLTKFFASPGYTDEVIYIYQASDLKPVTPQPEDEEVIEIMKRPLTQAIDDIKNGKIVDAKTIVGLLLVAGD